MEQRKTNERRLAQIVPERLREARVARGYTITELASAIGVTRQAISQFELGHATPSGAILAKIIDLLNLPLAYFTNPLNHQQVPSGVIFFRSLASANKKSREMLFVKAKWLEKIYLYLNKFLLFPKVNLPEFDVNDILTEEEIENIAIETRKTWGLGLGPISNVLLLLEKQGIISTRSVVGEQKLDACSQWRGDRPFIFLSSDKESCVRSRFDAAHELGHLLLHIWVDQVQFNDPKILKRLEYEASYFAGAFLLPKESFGQEVLSTSISHFITLKKRWKVSIAAMIKRCENLGILSDNQITYLWKQIANMKYRAKEPLDDEITPEEPNVLKQGMNLLISNNVKTPTEILDELKLPPEEIETLCNLPKGTLTLEGKIIPLKIKNN